MITKTLVCDWCGAKAPLDNDDWARGWSSEAGDDLCPDCLEVEREAVKRARELAKRERKGS